jgi:malate dehydrogenase (oxaloacetate-decarboxylating)(NADP+)
LADTAINVDPTAEELAEIALMTANAVKDLGYKPTIAMLSHSNFGSSKKTQAVKVRQAVQMMHKYYPEIDIDGEVQSDFALNAEMTANDFPFSKLTGKKVNTLIFPNLDAANITYKLMKELHGVKSIGPIMLGLNHPVHILQLRASVDEIVNMATFAVVDAQKQTKA